MNRPSVAAAVVGRRTIVEENHRHHGYSLVMLAIRIGRENNERQKHIGMPCFWVKREKREAGFS